MRRSFFTTINRRFLGDDSSRVLARSSNVLALHDDPAGGATPGVQTSNGGDGTAPGSMVITPQAGNNLSAVEQASQAARERIAKTGTSLPSPVAAQPRTDGGQFDAKPAVQVDEQTPEQKATAAAAAEAQRLADLGKSAEQIETERVAREQAAADAAAAAPTPEEIERTVELQVGDETLPIVFETPEVAQQVREAFEIAQQAEHLSTQAQKQIDEVLMVRESVAVDPVGFVMGEIGNNPAAVEHLVLSLVTREDATATKLLDTIKALIADPNLLRTTRAEQKSARFEYREEASQRIAESYAVRDNLKQVQSVVAALLPNTLTPAQQQQTYTDMMMDLKAYADRHQLVTLTPEDIPMLLNRRLAALGVDPGAAIKLANEAINRPPSRASGRGVAPNRVKSAATQGNGTAPARPAAPAPKTGSAFVASDQRRKAALVPGAGAGSPGGGSDLTPPRNADGSKMTSEQTIAWHRDRVKKGIRSYGQPAGA